MDILFEKTGRHNNQYVGRTIYNQRTYTSHKENLINKLKKVKMAQQHIALTADNILNRSELTRFERSDYKKKLVSANYAPPLEFCKSCSSGTPCQRQHAILTSSKYRRNIIEFCNKLCKK